jgi:hypothetical protein
VQGLDQHFNGSHIQGVGKLWTGLALLQVYQPSGMDYHIKTPSRQFGQCRLVAQIDRDEFRHSSRRTGPSHRVAGGEIDP